MQGQIQPALLCDLLHGAGGLAIQEDLSPASFDLRAQQMAAGVTKGRLNGLQLMQHILARLARLGHLNHSVQVARRTSEALDKLSVRSGPDAHSQPPPVQGCGAGDLQNAACLTPRPAGRTARAARPARRLYLNGFAKSRMIAMTRV